MPHPLTISRSILRPALRITSSLRTRTTSLPPSTSLYSTSGTSPTGDERQPNLLRNGLIASGLLAAAAVTYTYPEMFAFGGGAGGSGGASGSDGEDDGKKKTFVTRIRTSRGVVEHVHDLLPPSAVERRLHENESTKTFIPTKPTSVIRYDNNFVASNEPIEDRHAEDDVPHKLLDGSADPGLKGVKLFSIMDGHSGTATSELVSKTLHPMITLALRSLYAGNLPPTDFTTNISSTSQLKAFISKIYSAIPSALSLSSPLIVTPTNISNSLKSAFCTLDDQITSGATKLLPHIPNKPGKPNVRPIITPMVEPALSGSCAITVMVDEEKEDLYVASTGDCRAVAGYWVEGKDGKPSGWRCEVLTEDQMGDNPAEVKRMQSEHPASESNTVIMRGRVMGGLQPTRAFGDSRYKWTREEHEGINNLLPDDHPNKRKPSPHHKTPPYVTARPEVSHRTLKQEADGGQLKFVVVATDGLWDSISSQEAVGLVASHMEASRHPPVPASQITGALLPESPESAARYPSAADSPGGLSRTDKWVYEDDNAATHLIRNSLVGSSSRKSVAELLSMKYPVSRWLRDDVTCTVVYFGTSPAKQVDASSEPIASSIPDGPVKARL